MYMYHLCSIRHRLTSIFVSDMKYVTIIHQFCFFCFRHWLTNTYAIFGLPYFTYDIFAMYCTYIYAETEVQSKPFLQRLRHFAENSKAMLIHHVILPLILFPSIIVSSSLVSLGRWSMVSMFKLGGISWHFLNSVTNFIGFSWGWPHQWKNSVNSYRLCHYVMSQMYLCIVERT
jgi:hypothetical protein